MTRFAAVPRPARSPWQWPRRLIAGLLVLVIAVLVFRLPAQAALPLDHRSTAPNQSSELPGAGYLLTDPLQGPSRAYWAGAYRTIAGARAYCVDDFYDYPNASYGYRTPEVSHWSGRPGSNNGARGHTAQRIIWIINSYGQSTAASTDAAVSMAINLLTGSAPFLRSYASSFKPQLNALNPDIVGFINRMIADSDRYAGPYTTKVAFGSVPAVGANGHFTVQVRSARGFALPDVPFRVTGTAGIRLRSRGWGRTGPSGIATLVYTALRSGPVAIIAQGTAVPNITMRLGYSPTHNTGNFSTGSQRVALNSAHRLSLVAPGTAHATISAPSIRTVVRGGSVPRPVGVRVTDQVQASGLQPRANYRLAVTLQDSSGSVCGSAAISVHADVHGLLDTITPGIAVCGGGRDTFAERLLDVQGHPVVHSPPGQPRETFPVSPAAKTAVHGGVRPRAVGTPVSDEVQAIGLWPGKRYQVQANLQDATGSSCGSTTGSATSDVHGVLAVTLGPIKACGTGKDTFTERLTGSDGTVLATTTAWEPAETFPVQQPPAVHRPSPPKVSPPKVRPPPVAAPKLPPTPAVQRPVPHLASTGATPKLALVTGILGLVMGGLLLLAGRRSL
jgi:hypothetical protein